MPGYVLRQPDLAETYRVASLDMAPIGSITVRLPKPSASWMQANGGELTESDFAAYETVTRQPLRSQLSRL